MKDSLPTYHTQDTSGNEVDTISLREQLSSLDRDVFKAVIPILSYIIDKLDEKRKDESRENTAEILHDKRVLNRTENIAFELDTLSRHKDKTVDLLSELLDVVKGLRGVGAAGGGGGGNTPPASGGGAGSSGARTGATMGGGAMAAAGAGAAAGTVAGAMSRPPATTNMGTSGYHGGLSARFESGLRGSEAIGFDRTGGHSYGAYQIATNTGTMRSFMAYLQQNNPEIYQRLQAAGGEEGARAGTPEFRAAWQESARSGQLTAAEREFISQTHYDPLARKVQQENNLDLSSRSQALREVIFSTAVQHGGGTNVVGRALQRLGTTDASQVTDQQLISAIYEERGTRFGSSTEADRASVQRRFQDEQQRAQTALAGESAGGTQMSAGGVAGQQQTPATATAMPPPTVSGAGMTENVSAGANQPTATPVASAAESGPALTSATTESGISSQAATPSSGLQVMGASQENALAERTQRPPNVVMYGSAPAGQASPGTSVPGVSQSADDPGPVEPSDAAERYAKLFNMAA